jgi:hypothetical protein
MESDIQFFLNQARFESKWYTSTWHIMILTYVVK